MINNKNIKIKRNTNKKPVKYVVTQLTLEARNRFIFIWVIKKIYNRFIYA